VLGAVELLARGTGTLEGAGDVVVVDVGGATTDVYSVVDPGGTPWRENSTSTALDRFGSALSAPNTVGATTSSSNAMTLQRISILVS